MSEINGLCDQLPPHKRAIRLNTARDARRFLAKVINSVMRDEMEPGKGGRLGYLTGILLKSIEVSDLEQRVQDLEAQIGGGR